VSFILENDEQLDLLVYEYSDNILLLLEYCGTLLPKYMKLIDENSVV
jgi:hypothetical protein